MLVANSLTPAARHHGPPAAVLTASLLSLNCWRIGMAWFSPVMLATATGVFAGLSALTVQEIYCPYLDAGHIVGFHVGTLLSAVLLGALFGLTIPRIHKSLNWRKPCK
jgi:hypothetical protein